MTATTRLHRTDPGPAAGPPPATGAPPSAPGGWYRMKPAFQGLLRPVVTRLVARGISADLLTALAVPIAALGGVCLALSDRAPLMLIGVPILAALRLVLNLLDGQVARATGTVHPMGEVANELGDRVADVLFLGGLAFVAAVGPLAAGAAVTAALLASFTGLAARAAGAPRQYGGIMSKPARMIVLAVAAPAAWIAGSGRPLAAAAWLIALGGVVTVVQRLRATSGWVRDARP
jgi:CDP-diacylglycerol---glycerol-3-phosphate 3-phosphatidyltransferase